jgi:hypothetical protein
MVRNIFMTCLFHAGNMVHNIWLFKTDHNAAYDPLRIVCLFHTGKMVRNIYMMLFSSPGNKTAHHKQPTYKMLKQFVKHLDTNIVDYHTAIELQVRDYK